MHLEEAVEVLLGEDGDAFVHFPLDAIAGQDDGGQKHRGKHTDDHCVRLFPRPDDPSDATGGRRYHDDFERLGKQLSFAQAAYLLSD